MHVCLCVCINKLYIQYKHSLKKSVLSGKHRSILTGNFCCILFSGPQIFWEAEVLCTKQDFSSSGTCSRKESFRIKYMAGKKEQTFLVTFVRTYIYILQSFGLVLKMKSPPDITMIMLSTSYKRQILQYYY